MSWPKIYGGAGFLCALELLLENKTAITTNFITSADGQTTLYFYYTYANQSRQLSIRIDSTTGSSDCGKIEIFRERYAELLQMFSTLVDIEDDLINGLELSECTKMRNSHCSFYKEPKKKRRIRNTEGVTYTSSCAIAKA